jgi:hypothetical protein
MKTVKIILVFVFIFAFTAPSFGNNIKRKKNKWLATENVTVSNLPNYIESN